jgi:hypothetical protein
MATVEKLKRDWDEYEFVIVKNGKIRVIQVFKITTDKSLSKKSKRDMLQGALHNFADDSYGKA